MSHVCERTIKMFFSFIKIVSKGFNLFVTYTRISLSWKFSGNCRGAGTHAYLGIGATHSQFGERSKSAANFRGYFYFSSFISRASRSCTPTIVTYALWKINVAAIKITRFCTRARVRWIRVCPAPLKILQRKVMHYCNIAPRLRTRVLLFIISHWDDKRIFFCFYYL